MIQASNGIPSLSQASFLESYYLYAYKDHPTNDIRILRVFLMLFSFCNCSVVDMRVLRSFNNFKL